jgi:hypothetical protein
MGTLGFTGVPEALKKLPMARPSDSWALAGKIK